MSVPVPLSLSTSFDPVMEADQELQQVNDAVRKVEADIQSVEEKIDQASTEILRGGGPAIDSTAVKYWILKEEQLRKKEEQLRKKEEQLRKEKEQLRKEKELLLELRLVEAKGGKYLLICWCDMCKVLPSLMASVFFRC